MLSKLFAIIATALLLLEPNLPAAKPPAHQSGDLAKTAWLTTCIGPMTLQLAPQNRGAVLVAFGVGGCNRSTAYGFGLNFGKTVQKDKDKESPVQHQIRKLAVDLT